MYKITTFVARLCLAGLIGVVTIQGASAQNREVPSGDSLDQTPPIDQRAKQYNALPNNEKPTINGKIITSPPSDSTTPPR